MTERIVKINLDSRIGNKFYQLMCVMEQEFPDDFEVIDEGLNK